MSERLGRGAAAPPGLWADAARAWPVASGDRRGLGDRRGGPLSVVLFDSFVNLRLLWVPVKMQFLGELC